MKKWLFLATCFFVSQLARGNAPIPPAPIDGLVLRPALWTQGPAELEPEFKPLGLEWTSASKDGARSVRPKLELAGKPLNELLLRFKDGKVEGVTVIYYNRGDAGELSERDFEALLQSTRTSLDTIAGKPAVERGRDATSAVKAEGLIWDTATAKYLLEWSAVKASKTKMIPFRAEFVRLNILPPGSDERAVGAEQQTNGARQAVKRFVGSEHISRVTGGDVKLKDVPMVDQGQKGYCVVASVERVMRYYGAEVDQHELAQIANSDASNGTSVNAMMGSLKKLTSRLGVKTKEYYSWQIDDFLKLVEDYNRSAKRAKVREVALTGQVIDVDEMLMQMKPEIYKETRLKKTADFGKFQREIQRSIDEGIPLLWSVRLGMVQEKEIPQAFGGHMRLIIGYNSAAKELIYSDSWGAGHEEKRMKFDDAWTITSGLFSVQPIGS